MKKVHVLLTSLVFLASVYVAKANTIFSRNTTDVKDSSLLRYVVGVQGANPDSSGYYLEHSVPVTLYGTMDAYYLNKSGVLQKDHKIAQLEKAKACYDPFHKRWIYIWKEDGKYVVGRQMQFVRDTAKDQPTLLTASTEKIVLSSMEKFSSGNLPETPVPCLKRGKRFTSGEQIAKILYPRVDPSYPEDPDGMLDGDPAAWGWALLDHINQEVQIRGILADDGTPLRFNMKQLIYIFNHEVVIEPITGHIATSGFSHSRKRIIPLEGGRENYPGERGFYWYARSERIPTISLFCGNIFSDGGSNNNYQQQPQQNPDNNSPNYTEDNNTSSSSGYVPTVVRVFSWWKTALLILGLFLLWLLWKLLHAAGGGGYNEPGYGGGNGPTGYPPPNGGH